MRRFISLLEQAGELTRIKEEVHWKYEIGEKTRKAQLSGRRCPAFLFENIKDYSGCRVLTNGLGSHSKIAIARGLDPAASWKSIVENFRSHAEHPVDPVITDDSPVKENIFIGDDVNLLNLPVPWWSKEDGGRYIGTWHLNVTKDPETHSRNAGIYRMQLLGPRKTAISTYPKSHLSCHLKNAEKNGRPLEMAVAIGVEETLIMAAASGVPYGMDEYRLAGGLHRSPISLIRCQTIDLEVPASSEVVIEGVIHPKQRVREGPFLDYTGISKGNPNALVFEVSCLMFRNDFVFRGAAIGVPGAEDHLLISMLASAGYLDFHGSRIKQTIQNALLKKHLYRPFQFIGKLRSVITNTTKDSLGGL